MARTPWFTTRLCIEFVIILSGFTVWAERGNLDLRTSHQDTGDRASAEHGILYGLHAVLVDLPLRFQKFGKIDQEFVICRLLVSSGSEGVDPFNKHTISKKSVHMMSKFIGSSEINHNI